MAGPLDSPLRSVYSCSEVVPGTVLEDLKAIQSEIARRVIVARYEGDLRVIGGCDVSYSLDGRMQAVWVLMRYPGLEEIEWVHHEAKVSFPYVTTYLSFREMPVLIDSFRRLSRVPDAILVDGQGIAHPRGVGIASHLGVELDLPSVGCAKSHLYGNFQEPGMRKGDLSPLTSKGTQIGAVLRTRDGVRPLFVSPGHRVDVQDSVRLCLSCCKKYRNPEPLRRAHHLSRRSIDGRI
jgi:deoxyribonuclease V